MMEEEKGQELHCKGTKYSLSLAFSLFLLWLFWEVLKCLVPPGLPPESYRGDVPVLVKIVK